MMNNGEVFLITTYCDTHEKVNALEQLVDKLTVEGHDIIVYSHSVIPDYLAESVEYCIYDSTNPIVPERAMVLWDTYDGDGVSYKLSVHNDDYGYAVMQMIRRGINFAKSVGYSRVYVANYDLDYKTKIYDNTRALLNKFDRVVFSFNDHHPVQSIFIPYFAVNLTESVLNDVNKISKEHYLDYFKGDNYTLIPEHYASHIFTRGNCKLLSYVDLCSDRYDLKETMSATTGHKKPGGCTYFDNRFGASVCIDTATNSYVLVIWKISHDFTMRSLFINDKHIMDFDLPDTGVVLPLPFITTDMLTDLNIMLQVSHKDVYDGAARIHIYLNQDQIRYAHKSYLEILHKTE